MRLTIAFGAARAKNSLLDVNRFARRCHSSGFIATVGNSSAEMGTRAHLTGEQWRSIRERESRMNDKLDDGCSNQGRRAASMESLLLRHGIESALVGVPKLARVLGMGASTIYTYIREGRFFLPYRMVNATPMVKVDDLVEWYLSADGEVSPSKQAPLPIGDGGGHAPAENSDAKITQAKRGRNDFKVGNRPVVEYRPLDVATQEAADRAVDGLVAGVMRRIQRQQRAVQPGSRCV